jgi:uncharacterized protein YbaP (TraB family)
MKHLICALLTVFTFSFSFSQNSKIKANKYPSLLWEIKGKGITKPSYLFGTMHVSSKMAFNLSDSFYLGIKSAQVVALETNPGTWQEDFSRYDMDGEGMRNMERYGYSSKEYNTPQDYLSINTLKLSSYEKMMEAALYSNPSIINNFLYRTNSGPSSDFEEDTYLDLHIFQAGKKLGKKICGVEDFHGSMQLVKEAYADAVKEKNKKEKSYDYDEDLSFRNMEEAYRTGNLDLLDTINKVNSQSAAFDEKFLYKRNEIQAVSIDSILKRGNTLFVGVGAAHLPGERGVIEMLRRMGYTLRPIKMKVRDNQHKDAIEKIRVPVQFSKQISEDGFFSVNVPGKLYSFGRSYMGSNMEQFADMINGSYYMVSRILTNAAILGHSQAQVERKIDSVLYENIPGKILNKKSIVKNGYRGFEIVNRTRRGDHQRYNIFITPFEIIIFKMSGNGEYVKLGTEADQFFNSIQLKELKPEWKKFTPSYGGFEAELPHEPLVCKADNWQYNAFDAGSKTAFEIIRTDVHNFNFLEEDSFDLNLMEESFASSEFIQRQLSRKPALVNGYKVLDVKYKFKDSSMAVVRFIINGPRYYTLVAKAQTESKTMQQFIQSFKVKPFVYGEAKKETDTALYFTVKTPVPLVKEKKLNMFPENIYSGGYQENNDDDSLIDNGKYIDKVIENDSTGERIYVSFYKTSPYYYEKISESDNDSSRWADGWVFRNKKVDTLSDKTIVTEYELGNKNSGRILKSKSIEKDGKGYSLQTQLDSLSAPSAFITSFFETFAPVDTVKGVDVKKKKAGLFFSQFFSKDTTEHKIALKNLYQVQMDSTDFPELKKAIESLSWREKKYLDTKKEFIEKLSSIATNEAAEYVKGIYYAAGDTIELQYTALETLLQQSTAYSYKTFAGILENDPPILNLKSSSTTDYSTRRYTNDYSDYDYENYSDGEFMNNLEDTVQLTADIYKNLLPLITLDDYEQPVMELTATLLDSNMIGAKDYEAYLPKFVIEAKQLLKKQLIQEKTKAIEKAQETDDEKKSYNRYNNNDADYGNSRLSLYAKLLLPFWDKNTQVPQIITQMLVSKDKRLKYNTAILLLRNKKAIPDTMLNYFAGLDEYRYELYDDLKTLKQLSSFPAAHKNQLAIARSQMLSEQSYSKPDTVAFMEKLPLDYKGRSGYIYVFKYKEKKDDNSWKLATVGLLPKDETVYEFDAKDEKNRDEEFQYDFTDITGTKLTTEIPEKEQLQKLLKKLVYSKRKSAAQFYTEEKYSDYEYSRNRY